MKRAICAAVCAVGLLGVGMAPARALTISSQLKPGALGDDHLSVQIQVEDKGKLKAFKVTVHPKQGKLSPFFFSDLSLNKNGEAIASIPVQPLPEGKTVIYRFDVAPDTIADSRFQFDESVYGYYYDDKGEPIKDEDGKPKLQPMIGGRQYWFNLQDFAAPAR